MKKYPEELPLPVADGYGFKPVSPFMRTKMNTGRSRQRRAYSSVPTELTADFLFEDDMQTQLFESWFEEVLTSGVDWFECELKTPQGIRPYKVRFTDIYEGPTLDGGHWRFRAPIELLERPILTGGWALYAPDYIAAMNLIDLAINRDWPS
ncbi:MULTISPECIES: hypothetical protein [Pseudomonas]|uniref:Uncharacterized protein n=1 Tax=Pseudomonas salomonii TaxID=191391 RepID=A0A7Y8GG09_9PSED|nr:MULTISPECIES: hypothetical protein [Pseudomonas]NWF10183.1 hypothetical protein [Pseudomonas salomonii]WLH86037.1 hypothetical protein PSH96_06205 [Pseudomonas sp. FP2338]